MKYTTIFMLVFSLAVCLVSCNKEGLQGITGPAGSAGAAGAVGPSGKDGSIFLKGKGTPGAELGHIGDYYLDAAGGGLYGPKTAAGWGSPFSFAGDEGGKIYGGSGTPGAALGVSGDFYLDTAGYTLYGPKQENDLWGPGIYLNGTSGSTGVTEYVMNDPNRFFDSIGNIESDNFSMYIPNDDNNKFNLWKKIKDEHDLVKVYLKGTFSLYDEGDDSYYLIISAAGVLDEEYNTNTLIRIGYATAEDGLYISFSRIRYICECDGPDLELAIERYLGLAEIRVYVISPSSVNSISPPAGPGI